VGLGGEDAADEHASAFRRANAFFEDGALHAQERAELPIAVLVVELVNRPFRLSDLSEHGELSQVQSAIPHGWAT
jgi:hypothetical protein